ncbi:MAG: sensor histidine kinase [Citrobacter freundii]|nr:MAG: sensor histidine kinase [Citrobacter freundii]
MSKLLNYSLKKIIVYAGIVLACSIPVYYFAISRLWQYELDEHQVMVTPEAGREDSFLIIGAVTLLSALFFVLLMGGLILLNRRLSRRMWKPFYKSLEKIRSFDLSKTDNVQLDRSGISEFDELNTSLEKLLSANITVFNQQKEFADNASHELQTPLAIVQSKLELLSQSKKLDDEQYQLIEEAMSAISRASRINRNLLLLTKIENSQYSDQQEMNLSEMIRELIEQFQPFFEDKTLLIDLRIDDGVIVKGNPTLTEIMISNLLTNAIRYSSNNETISVYLSEFRMTVENPGGTALQTDQLFKRFASASTVSPGTGLGLALVKQICARHGWNEQYHWENGKHVFEVVFR